MAEETKGKPTVENRWWAEVGRSKEQPALKRPAAPAGDKFFKIAEGYDQDRARDNLTDLNLRLINEAHAAEGEWGYIQLLDTRFPQRHVDRIKRVLDLPSYARGVVIDSGRTVRLLVTGTPPGERILELALVEAPSFDCWVKGEWVREEIYNHADKALARFRDHIRNYLSPEAISEWEANAARA